MATANLGDWKDRRLAVHLDFPIEAGQSWHR
jgi:hypothetical protein